ncbi:MAG: hypothetical protein ACJ8GV_14795 [Luteimonas sp.]
MTGSGDRAGDVYKVVSIVVGALSPLSIFAALFGFLFFGAAFVQALGEFSGLGALLSAALVTIWPLAGLVGIASWAYLSLQFWRGNSSSLRRVHGLWWVGLALGALAALPLVAMEWASLVQQLRSGALSLMLLPSLAARFAVVDGLLLASAFLAHLRLRAPVQASDDDVLRPDGAAAPRYADATLQELMQRQVDR